MIDRSDIQGYSSLLGGLDISLSRSFKETRGSQTFRCASVLIRLPVVGTDGASVLCDVGRIRFTKSGGSFLPKFCQADWKAYTLNPRKGKNPKSHRSLMSAVLADHISGPSSTVSLRSSVQAWLGEDGIPDALLSWIAFTASRHAVVEHVMTR